MGNMNPIHKETQSASKRSYPRTGFYVDLIASKLSPMEALKLRRYHKKQTRMQGLRRRQS